VDKEEPRCVVPSELERYQRTYRALAEQLAAGRAVGG